MTPADLMLSKEIEVAVDWWANTLLGPVIHDSGDATTNSVIGTFASKLKPVSEEQIQDFKTTLKALLACHCAEWWNPDDPNWASAWRSIGTDYGPDRVLSCALDFAGIGQTTLRLPIKTNMHIDPGSVTVGMGHGAAYVPIYQEAKP